jgi:hypothetical protein
VFNTKLVSNTLIYLQKQYRIFLRCLDIFTDFLLTSALNRNPFPYRAGPANPLSPETTPSRSGPPASGPAFSPQSPAERRPGPRAPGRYLAGTASRQAPLRSSRWKLGPGTCRADLLARSRPIALLAGCVRPPLCRSRGILARPAQTKHNRTTALPTGAVAKSAARAHPTPIILVFRARCAIGVLRGVARPRP